MLFFLWKYQKNPVCLDPEFFGKIRLLSVCQGHKPCLNYWVLWPRSVFLAHSGSPSEIETPWVIMKSTWKMAAGPKNARMKSGNSPWRLFQVTYYCHLFVSGPDSTNMLLAKGTKTHPNLVIPIHSASVCPTPHLPMMAKDSFVSLRASSIWKSESSSE